MPTRGKPPLVEVRWHDAYLRSSSATRDDAVKDAEHSVRLTVGWLIEESDKVVRVAMTFDPGDDGEEPEFDDRYTIPRAYVDRIRYVERGPTTPRKRPATEDAGCPPFTT